jgi:hypothetical protein
MSELYEIETRIKKCNSVKEIIKILKEEVESIGIEVKNGLGTTQSKYSRTWL